MLRGRAVVIATLVVANVIAHVAEAEAASDDPAEVTAAAAFEEGKKAFLAGDYAGAARAFERAYEAKPHHDPLWNAALARHKTGETARAANLYARYLDEAPADAPDRDRATAALTALRSTLGRLEIDTAEGITDVRVDGVPTTRREHFVDPGEHRVEAGGAAMKIVRLAAGESLHVTLAREEAPAAPAPPRDDGRFSIPWPVFAAGAVLTAGGTVATIWSGLDTVAQKERFDETGTQEDLDEGRSRRTRTNIILGVTIGIAVLTTASVFFVDWGGRDRRAARTPSPFVWRF
jgi:hypothetical protein